MNANKKTIKTTTMSATKPLRRNPVMNEKNEARRFPATSLGAWSLAGVVMSFVAGCGPEMDPPSLVEKTRVLGARIEVAGDTARATPKPGETAKVTWLITAPAEVPPLGWAFVLCPGRGSPEAGCGEQPLAVFQGHERVPAIDVAVPAADELGGARELLIFGRVCSASEPVLGANGAPGCTMNGDGTTAVVSIPLQMTDSPNHNPSFAGRGATFDGQAWATGDADACAGLPTVRAATEDHVLRLETDGNDRERFTAMIGDPPVPTERREVLQVSQFTTAGKLERSYSKLYYL
jgi:hypothetical protein